MHDVARTVTGRHTAGRGGLRILAAAYKRLPRFVTWSIASLVGLVILSMVIDAAVYAGKIHAGVTIVGHEVSGMTREQATTSLAGFVVDNQDRTVTLSSDDESWTVSPASIGLKIDIDATVSAALGATRDSNVFADQASKLRLYFSIRDVPLSSTFDEAKLDALVDQVSAAVDKPAIDARLAFSGAEVSEVPAQNGLTVDREALSHQLIEALCQPESSELAVPVVVAEPELTTEDLAPTLAQTQVMLSGPLTLTSVRDSWTFTAAQVAHFIDFRTEKVQGVPTLVPYLSLEKLAPSFQLISNLMSPTPVDAYFEGDDEKAWVVPDVPGRVLKPQETADALGAAALKTEGRTVEAVVTLTEAEFTAADAEAMGINDCLAVRETSFVGTRNRQNNVRVATAAIDNNRQRFLAPGEEFSFLEAVGPRTPEQGYREAPGIQKDGSLEGELGGGICQVATTLFNSVFFAGLEVTERRNHTMYISHYPEGRDAAVSSVRGVVDLKFVNDTDHHIWIRGESDGVHTTFWIYGTSDGRKVTFRNSGKYNIGPAPTVETTVDPSLPAGKTVVISPGQPYMTIKVTRWTTWPDGTVKEDIFMSKFQMRPKIIHVGPTT